MNYQDYVSKNTAKLLKAAGYPQNTPGIAVIKTNYSGNSEYDNLERDLYVMPSLWAAMEWLKKKGLLVVVNFDVDSQMSGEYPSYTAQVYSYGERIMEVLKETHTYYNECRKAYNAGIAAACEWLISRAGNKNGTLSPNPSETDENHPKKALNFRLTDLLTTLMSPPKLGKNHSEKE